MDAEDLARGYYDAIDAGDYDRLGDLLAPEFTQYRPDRTFEGRGEFVQFMREDRPMTDTEHDIGGVYTNDGGVAVQGCLRDASGEELFAFVDVFAIEDGALAALETYTE